MVIPEHLAKPSLIAKEVLVLVKEELLILCRKVNFWFYFPGCDEVCICMTDLNSFGERK